MAKAKTPKGPKLPLDQTDLDELGREFGKCSEATAFLIDAIAQEDWLKVGFSLQVMAVRHAMIAEWSLANATRVNAFLKAAGLDPAPPITAEDLT